MSASVAAPSLEAGLLHHVPIELPERQFIALRLAARRPTRAVTAFLNQLGIAEAVNDAAAERQV